MAKETFTFQAEVGKILDIVAHSLYSEKEVFLRELISNSSDACDKLRYATITDSKLAKDTTDFKIEIDLNKKEKTITISDNGIGMTRDEMVESLGTIANQLKKQSVIRLPKLITINMVAKRHRHASSSIENLFFEDYSFGSSMSE